MQNRVVRLSLNTVRLPVLNYAKHLLSDLSHESIKPDFSKADLSKKKKKRPKKGERRESLVFPLNQSIFPVRLCVVITAFASFERACETCANLSKWPHRGGG